MKIKKGDKLLVYSSRGKSPTPYKAIATKDFDTENDEWYEVEAEEVVKGLSNVWNVGEHVPCRRGLNKVEVREDERDN